MDKTMQEFEPITKDNIKEVLNYNRGKFNVFVNYEIKKDSFAIDFTVVLNGIDKFNYIIQTDDFNEFLTFIQKRVDLKPLPKFDFEGHLVSRGFKKIEDKLIKGAISFKLGHNEGYLNLEGTNLDSAICFKYTVENADILLQAASTLDILE